MSGCLKRRRGITAAEQSECHLERSRGFPMSCKTREPPNASPVRTSRARTSVTQCKNHPTESQGVSHHLGVSNGCTSEVPQTALLHTWGHHTKARPWKARALGFHGTCGELCLQNGIRRVSGWGHIHTEEQARSEEGSAFDSWDKQASTEAPQVPDA